MRGTRFALPWPLFKRLAVAVGAAVIASVLLATGPLDAGAQAPDEDWRTLSTPHFRVTFPSRLEALGRKAADRSERAWAALSTAFIEPPDDRIDVLLTDHADVSNGFAQVTPSNRITIYARPPVDELSLGFMDDWLELVITHELAHILHLDYVSNPIGVVARTVFGRVPADWPYFPELGTPRWIIEGLATWYESDLSHAGRVRGTFEEMQLRTAALEGRFEDVGQASGDSPLWPGGNRPYAYGSLFFDFLLERHGDEKMTAFVEAIAGQWVPYRIDAAGRDAFGVSISDEWKVWEASWPTREELERRLSGLMPVTEAEQLTRGARWGLLPTPSPDGRWIAYTRSDGQSDVQLRRRSADGSVDQGLGRTNGLATFAWLPDGRLLVSQLELDGPYRVYGDLYLFDPDGGTRRLTDGARLTQPSVHPDGMRAVAVHEGDGTNELVEVDLATGRTTVLAPAVDSVHWAYPSVSPDGRWIAATRWTPDAMHDVVVLDAGTGRVARQVTHDRALDMGPRWTADGRWLVWTSDRTGIPNVLAVPVDPSGAAEGNGSTGEGVAADGSPGPRIGTPRLLTNVLTGAAHPAVDPSGRWLYFSGYHVDGWEVERVPFAPGDAPPAPNPDARFAMDAPGLPRGEEAGQVGGYSPFPTLLPTYWELSYSDPLVTPAIVTDDLSLPRRELLGFGIGARTGGRDLVGRHSYDLEARVTTSGNRFEGSFGYSWAGLGNPVLRLFASQGWSDGGQQVAGDMDQDTLLILERERLVEGAITVVAPTYRRNLSLTVSSGLVWEERQVLETDLRTSAVYELARPDSRLWDVTASVNFNSTRSFSFQMGTARGIGVFLLGRWRRELSVPDSLSGVYGADRSTGEVIGRVRGALPLWGGGFARHTLAFQASGGIAGGPGAGPLTYRVGGASGQPEPVSGFELFGGNAIFFPVRGYDPSRLFGRYAWSASGEYRFPIWLVNRGFGAWPLFVDRAVGSLFVDAGNAWGPDVTPGGFENPLGMALASVGAEMTTQFLLLYDVQLQVRGGAALPLVDGDGPRFYVRVGLAY